MDVNEGVHLIAWPFVGGGCCDEGTLPSAGPPNPGAALRVAVREGGEAGCGKPHRVSRRAGPGAPRPARGCYDRAMAASYSSPLAQALSEDVLERFVRYARVDTQSERGRTQSPSTPGQLDLARILVSELEAIGAQDVTLDDNGYVFATLPATGGSAGAPAIGLIAHMDVSPDAPGAGVEPIVHRGYAGRRIELPRDGTVLDPEDMPVLAGKAGH